jgi:hypothetical protein
MGYVLASSGISMYIYIFLYLYGLWASWPKGKGGLRIVGEGQFRLTTGIPQRDTERDKHKGACKDMFLPDGKTTWGRGEWKGSVAWVT